jgi:tetratricopeptide (TPR) repeat protein
MKTSFMLFSMLFVFSFTKAQDDYKKVMLENIKALDTAADTQSLNKLVSVFTAVYDVKKDWHPLYYECLGYIKLSQAYQNTEQKKAAIQKAADLLDGLPTTNDEVLVLKGLYALDYLAIDRSEWQTYLPMLNNSLKKAQDINPDNPRSYYLQGLLKYNMPTSMGGGHEEGIKLFQQSMDKFESYKTTDDLSPTWGKKEVEKYLSK